MQESESRAAGALYGLAIGDALGMPTQSLPREQIIAWYGVLIGGFRAAAPDHPLAAGKAAGSVTDDTEQAVLLARLLIERDGRADPAELARRLMAWEASMRARGSLDLLGPSTRRAVSALAAGASVTEAGKLGTSNGAAMRITPAGITTPADDLGVLVDRVEEASMVTHNTGLALAGAAAAAAAVSAGLDGADVPAATEVAVAAARRASTRGYWAAGADVAARISWAASMVAGLPAGAATSVIYTLVERASRPRNRYPQRSRCSPPVRPIPGWPAGSAPPSAATATPSRRWPVPSPVPVTAPGPSRPTPGLPSPGLTTQLDELAEQLLALRAGSSGRSPRSGFRGAARGPDRPADPGPSAAAVPPSAS